VGGNRGKIEERNHQMDCEKGGGPEKFDIRGGKTRSKGEIHEKDLHLRGEGFQKKNLSGPVESRKRGERGKEARPGEAGGGKMLVFLEKIARGGRLGE